MSVHVHVCLLVHVHVRVCVSVCVSEPVTLITADVFAAWHESTARQLAKFACADACNLEAVMRDKGHLISSTAYACAHRCLRRFEKKADRQAAADRRCVCLCVSVCVHLCLYLCICMCNKKCYSVHHSSPPIQASHAGCVY